MLLKLVEIGWIPLPRSNKGVNEGVFTSSVKAVDAVGKTLHFVFGLTGNVSSFLGRSFLPPISERGFMGLMVSLALSFVVQSLSMADTIAMGEVLINNKKKKNKNTSENFV